MAAAGWTAGIRSTSWSGCDCRDVADLGAASWSPISSQSPVVAGGICRDLAATDACGVGARGCAADESREDGDDTITGTVWGGDAYPHRQPCARRARGGGVLTERELSVARLLGRPAGLSGPSPADHNATPGPPTSRVCPEGGRAARGRGG